MGRQAGRQAGGQAGEQAVGRAGPQAHRQEVATAKLIPMSQALCTGALLQPCGFYSCRTCSR